MRQTPYIETISPQLKGQDNTTKQKKLVYMARSNKKMVEENRSVKSTQSTLWLARTTSNTCQQEERKSLVSKGHSGIGEKRVVMPMGLS